MKKKKKEEEEVEKRSAKADKSNDMEKPFSSRDGGGLPRGTEVTGGRDGGSDGREKDDDGDGDGENGRKQDDGRDKLGKNANGQTGGETMENDER